MRIAERCRIHATSMDSEGWYTTAIVLYAAAELLDKQEAEHDAYVVAANANVCALNREIVALERIIYRNSQFMRHVDESTLNEIIAKYEPNTPDGG